MIRAISLFAGGGLADIGYEQAGYQIVGACEKDPAIAAVHKQNFPDTYLHEGDVATFPTTEWGDVDLIHLSPPCQQYSGALQRTHKIQDYRDPINDVAAIVRSIQPPHVVLENVKEYLEAPCLFDFHSELLKMGYWLTFCRVLKMGQLGVPQTRRRLIVIWSKSRDLCIKWSVPPIGWFDALSDQDMELRPFTGWLEKYTTPEHRELIEEKGPGRYMFNPSGYRPTTRKRGLTAIPGEDPGFTVVARNPTQLTVYIDGYLYQLRSRQYARLQTVPDDYVLPPQKGLAKKIIGNGVPPVITAQIGVSLRAAG